MDCACSAPAPWTTSGFHGFEPVKSKAVKFNRVAREAPQNQAYIDLVKCEDAVDRSQSGASAYNSVRQPWTLNRVRVWRP